MSILEQEKSSGGGNYWNYSNNEKENFSLTLEGMIVELKEFPATEYETNKPLLDKNGDQMVTVLIVFQRDEDEVQVPINFYPTGFPKGQLATDLLGALGYTEMNRHVAEQLLGTKWKIRTWEPADWMAAWNKLEGTNSSYINMAKRPKKGGVAYWQKFITSIAKKTRPFRPELLGRQELSGDLLRKDQPNNPQQPAAANPNAEPATTVFDDDDIPF